MDNVETVVQKNGRKVHYIDMGDLSLDRAQELISEIMENYEPTKTNSTDL